MVRSGQLDYNVEQMATNQFFLEATDHFYKTQYQKGIQKINKCLQTHQSNPTLLANRALFYSQMGHLQKAIHELQACIRLDYQNYISYFNLFSLKVRTNQLDQALKQLACSLSCLYLTRARFRKRDQDAKEAIKYAKNNVEAHVLRAMMFLQGKKLKECMNELDWAYEFDKSIPTLNKMRVIVKGKLGINQKDQQLKYENTVNPHVQRLICSYEPVEQDLMLQIKVKMTEFNSIYNDLNQQNAIVTHRVPRTLLPQQIEKLLTDNDLKEQIQELYELKYNADNVHEPVIYQMKEEYRVQKQIEFEERFMEEEVDRNSRQEHSQCQNKVEEINNSSLMDRVDHQDQQEISKLAANQQEDHILSNIIGNSQQKHTEGQEQQQPFQDQFNQYLVVDEYPQFPLITQQHSASQSKLQPSQQSIIQSKYQYLQSSVSSKDIQQPVVLYPMKRNIYGRFKIERFEIENKNLIAEFFQDQSQNNVLREKEMYCVCSYFKEKPGYKVTTCDRGLFFNSDTRMLECEWNQTFKEILLTQDPEQIFIKIYTKKTNSYNDDLVGVGSMLIDMSGQLVVSIKNANDSTEKLGQLYMKLFLID